jgi:hypothetical protein
MSIFSNTNIVAGASGKQRGYTIEESLRFNASQSSSLSRLLTTPTSAKAWTFSAWIKRGKLGTAQSIFISTLGGAGVPQASSYFTSSDTIQIYDYTGSVYTFDLTTTQVFRDSSAWYHLIFVYDSANATSSSRVRLYVNGVQITSFSSASYPTQNADCAGFNRAYTHYLSQANAQYFDGYLTEVNFIDGQALDPSDFGEYDSVTGVWKPVGYTGTYGTNGFYLPMQLDNTVEGFNTVTWVGTGAPQKISGVGFSPDFVWAKRRSAAASHGLVDAVRGAGRTLFSNSTDVEDVGDSNLISFDTDGFTAGSGGNFNTSGQTYVAWCWDAGSSTVSNTDGSITSSVRANPTYGFSIVTASASGTSPVTVGHGLGVAPSLIIGKVRDVASTNWYVYSSSIAASDYLVLNSTAAKATSSNIWDTAPTSTVFTVGNPQNGWAGGNSGTKAYVFYCFSEIAGYSKFGSYTGTGASGNTVTTGFKPSFVMVKRTDGSGDWFMFDSTRDVTVAKSKWLRANYSGEEVDNSAHAVTFTDTGFQLTGTDAGVNGSGQTYIYMAFKDTREYAYWLDDSGNNNDWQPNGGITTSSTVTDTPTPYEDGGNYAVLNPLNKGTNQTIASGNLSNTASAHGTVLPTIGVTSGLWYAEATLTTSGAGGIGFTINPQAESSYGEIAGKWWCYDNGGGFYIISQTTATASLSTKFSAGQVWQWAIDTANGKLWVGLNNSWFSSAGATTGNPATGANPTFTFTAGTLIWPMLENAAGPVWNANFGQRPFAYTPPTGFLPLHTGNLPDSAIVDGSQYFAIDTYSGTGATNARTIGFQPDFVWIKSRTNAYWHKLFDSVRGANKPLVSNDGTGELTETTSLMSFDSDGFTLGTSADSTVNNSGSGQTFVAWNWKANGAGVSNTDGSITSTVSANPTSGFSIVTYTGTGAAATVGHGLGVAPKMVIVKERGNVNGWYVYHVALGASNCVYLNVTNASTSVPIWNNTAPSSSVVSFNGGVEVNRSSGTYIAYCFADVEGYSKFGSYTGNGSTDGPFVYLGFRPAFVMMKRSNSTGEWQINDIGRSPTNMADARLWANSSSSESSNTGGNMDYLSNGFKLRNTNSDDNTNGGTYIFMAFAEHPFANALAR